MAYGKPAVNSPVPIIGAPKPDKDLIQKQLEANATQAAFNTRTQAIQLAINATKEETDTPGKRDGLILGRAILFESFIRQGSAGIKFVADDEKESNEPIQEKGSAEV